MDNEIKNIVNHEGRITKITDTTVFAEIISGSACASCHAKSICLPSEQKKILIKTAIPSDGTKYIVGEKVMVCMSNKAARKSVFLSYIMPLIAIFAAMGICKYYNIDENIGGLAAAIAVIGYYTVLYLFRKKIEQKFEFTIKKLSA